MDQSDSDIADSDDDLFATSITDEHREVIEASDSADESTGLEVSSNLRDSRDVETESESSDDDTQDFSATAAHDDSTSSLEQPVFRRKPANRRILSEPYSDSDTDVSHQSEAQNRREDNGDVAHESHEETAAALEDQNTSGLSDSDIDVSHQSEAPNRRKDNGGVVHGSHEEIADRTSSPEQPVFRRKPNNRRILSNPYSDSDTDVSHQSEAQNRREDNGGVAHGSHKETAAALEEQNTSCLSDSDIDVSHQSEAQNRRKDNEGVVHGSHEKTAAASEEQDTSCLTISDGSDSEDEFRTQLGSGQTTRKLPKSSFTSEDEAAVMPFVRKEIGVGNVDPVIEQQRAILRCNVERITTQLAKSKMLLNTANITLLPDKGEKLKRSIDLQKAELQNLSAQLQSLPQLGSPKPNSNPVKPTNPSIPPPWKVLSSPQQIKPLGKKALETQEREQSLTEERLKDLHGSLNARPGENERAQDPKGLKVSLMPHQQHALAWLLWREKQRPHGGILADDMGLGKTLTMISLILTTLEEQDSDDENSDDEWLNRNKSVRPKGGTLVVCPASVLSQWDSEIRNRVKRGLLSVELFHGTQRETSAKRLSKNDVVITTYNLLSREYNKGNSDSILHKITWRRIILDEAHIVRNHKSQASEAVCNMYARSRWALTGTPIQNKELDLYSLLKFLQCSPFDDLRVWKRWVDNKNAHGHERLATVMKSLMLRRTKIELQAKGGLGTLPDKNLEEIAIKLDPEEQLVYEKVLVYSRTLFAQFLYQRAEKNHVAELNAGKFDAPRFLQTPKDTQFTNAQNQLLARHADVKAHEILVLLLRLRQICCQPSLIHAMLDREDLKGNDIVDEGGTNVDLVDRLGSLNLEDGENIDPNEIGVDRRVVENLLTSENPVFDPTRQSSKMRAVLETLQKIIKSGDKIVVVSQWTSMLNVVQTHLDSVGGITYGVLSGAVPVKNRQHIVESFNKANAAPQILLLSLTAGGVGLNLIGGNHLLLLDIHWNPQLEAQAQDRIYRVGQTKSVYIYKFMCIDTIEQRIKALQDKKLAIAQGVLTGAGTAGASKLTLDDLKSLFSL